MVGNRVRWKRVESRESGRMLLRATFSTQINNQRSYIISITYIYKLQYASSDEEFCVMKELKTLYFRIFNHLFE